MPRVVGIWPSRSSPSWFSGSKVRRDFVPWTRPSISRSLELRNTRCSRALSEIASREDRTIGRLRARALHGYLANDLRWWEGFAGGLPSQKLRKPKDWSGKIRDECQNNEHQDVHGHKLDHHLHNRLFRYSRCYV